jgi:Rps23 Pro-64 3,4-dihydroxylase Tpa1-like proline 4-hydroxylase
MPDHAVSLAYEKVVNCFVTSFEMELRNIITSIEIDEETVFTSEKGVDYKKLKQFVRPALFGKGNKTVYDKSVRNAFDIPAERLVIKRNSEDLDNICEIFSTQMEKYAPDGFILKPKLYKLQAYEKGGFFKVHRDTLHGDNHFATLLVSLSWSSDYEGGNLILTDSNRNKQTFKLSRGKVLFFLTDTLHEVTRVTKGERISLQFDVYLEKKRTKAASSSKKLKFKNFMSDELDDYDEFEMYRQKVPIGSTKKAENTLKLLQEIDKFVQKHPRTISSFFLEHSYHVGITPDYLRGSDRFLYEILSDKYDIEFGSVINKHETNYEGTFAGIDRFNFQIVDGPLAKEFISKIDMSTSYKVKERQRPLFFGSSCSPDCIGRSHYVEYSGNEACPGEYVYHMMVLSIFNPKSAEKCSDYEIENAENVSDSNTKES